MTLFDTPEERCAAEAIAALCYCNPFLPQRIELEQRALGPAHQAIQDAWSLGEHGLNPNIEQLARRAWLLVERAGGRLRAGAQVDAAERELYEDLVCYHLYAQIEKALLLLAQSCERGGLRGRSVGAFRLFEREALRLCDVPGPKLSLHEQLPHVFAILFQTRRAFHLVYENILGGSAAAVALRAAVWQSIFTHDLRRYRKSLYANMQRIPTLVVGPSGTGKELVARAIGMSRYIPFDARERCFKQEHATSFIALNVAALAPTLVESELFGHSKGAFTDAGNERAGWLEACAEHGCLFLDEIGELAPSVQVKLLRVLQARQLTRVGETRQRAFEGKLVAATNRDLAAMVEGGEFREDFYYRLCADVIETPSLRAQLQGRPEDLPLFVGHALKRLVDEGDLQAATAEVTAVIERELSGYAWPGNVRELEQCVGSILVRGSYLPRLQTRAGDAEQRLLSRFARGEEPLETLSDAYVTLAYFRAGNLTATAQRLGLDARTVKRKLDPALLAQLRDKAA